MIILELPTPPSVNNLYFNLPKGRGRARTTEYLNWQILAGWHIQKARQKPISGPVEITYEHTDAGRVDLGNYEKPLTDLLVAHRLIEDDNRSIVRDLHAKWSPEVSEGVRVTVVPACVSDQPSDAEDGG